MLYLPFTFRVSTKEEIEFFSERFSNVYARNPKVKFATAELHKENYAIFATKEENDETTRILFFLIFDHPLKEFRNIYSLFCAFIKEMTHVEPIKENLGKSKRICWNLQEEKYIDTDMGQQLFYNIEENRICLDNIEQNTCNNISYS